jgi:hypothetical protein
MPGAVAGLERAKIHYQRAILRGTSVSLQVTPVISKELP